MESHSRSSSFSGSHVSDERLPIPATVRLQRAMEAHAALQARTFQQQTSVSHLPQANLEAQPMSARDTSTTLTLVSVDDLGTQLRNLWRREQDKQQENQNTAHNDEGPIPSLKSALKKIGSREKDELLIHLLEHQESLRTQRVEVAALGEKIAAQLLHQQHELRQKYREQITKLEEQLHDAVHFNPQVVALQAKVEELEGSNREHEQKLRFAVRSWNCECQGEST